MKKFIAMYMIPVSEMDAMMKNSDPEQMQKMKDSWKAWMQQHASSFVDMGTPVGKNKRVTTSGVQDVRNELTGYSIVQAETAEEAAKLFLDNPHLQMPGSYVDVAECVEMKM